ncbi:hypothetical protein [Nonomuraea pusilla]|uniref:Uncharacterized protein n=1 Tax=Nonomuraea pusilla TaxID=46177 RepID=A0A1H7W9K5_9ACTN|nr:hypothetical protein [Nonomuraea pusilla]SEM18272.1 hypothetical protein SAMN05660976_04427 [Nonomuraea pusilla]
MTDHDREAGSRGEEEVPRDPTSRDTREQPAGLRYGEGAGAQDDVHPSAASGRAGRDRHDAEDPEDPEDSEIFRYRHDPYGEPRSFRAFLRQRHAQIIGAGLAGLVAGAVLGGTAVAALDGRGHRDHGGWEHTRMEQWPSLVGPSACLRTEGEMRCRLRVPEEAPPGIDPTVAPPIDPTLMPGLDPTLEPRTGPTRTG